jgi:hypothetical protein
MQVICPTCQNVLRRGFGVDAGDPMLLCMGLFSTFWCGSRIGLKSPRCRVHGQQFVARGGLSLIGHDLDVPAHLARSSGERLGF